MDIERLKQKILDLAIRGKLVPQNPNDEPASVLVDKICSEKEELIRQGKIKRSKDDSYIFKGSDNCYYEKINGITKNITEEIPFDIPDNWAWCRVGAISNYGCNIIVDDSQIPKDAWVLELEDIESYTSILLSHKRKENRIFGSSKYKFNKGDLLFSKLRVYLKKVIIADENGYCSSEIFPLNFAPYCLNEYAAIFFISPYILNKIAQIEYGCKMPRLGTKDGKHLLFPLPPQNEQKNIVSIYNHLLSKINILRDSSQDLYKHIDILKTKILDYYFGENSCYKSYYENVLLENVCKITMGQSVDGSSITKKQTLSSVEFHQGKIAFGDIYLKSSNKYTLAPKKIIDKNSVVICVRAPVGDINITDRSISIGRGLCGLSSNKVKLMYLYYYLLYKGSYFRSLSQGSTFASITIKTINKTPFLMCNDDLQNKIITHIQKAFDLIDKIKEQLI